MEWILPTTTWETHSDPILQLKKGPFCHLPVTAQVHPAREQHRQTLDNACSHHTPPCSGLCIMERACQSLENFEDFFFKRVTEIYSQMTATARAESPMLVAGVQPFRPSSAAFLGISAGSWIRSRVTGMQTSAHMGCQCCRQRCNPLCHSASPLKSILR